MRKKKAKGTKKSQLLGPRLDLLKMTTTRRKPTKILDLAPDFPAGSLIESLDDIIDEDAEAAWKEEIARRLEDVRSGKVKTTPWNEVRQKGRAQLHNS